MARIDLLTAQMRQRTVSRVSIQSDEKMKLFDANQHQVGAGAALSAATIQELLGEIAPVPLNGAPVTFPYSGRDGQFEVMVAPGAKSFEMRVLSFTPAQSEPLQTHIAPQTQSAVPSTTATEARWYHLEGERQLGPHTDAELKTMIRSGTLRRDVYVWHDGLSDWQMAGHSQFKTFFAALPTPSGDPDGTWYYRSATGQPVPLERSLLVEKIRSGALAPDTWVWREGQNDWTSATTSELASSLSARSPMQTMAPQGLAPIAPPTGGSYTGPRTLPGTGPYSVYGGGDPSNTSGNGSDAEVPREAQGLFNFGAFLFPTWWCRAHNLDQWATGIVILNVASRWFFPLQVIKLPICFYMGFMGNRIGWRNRRFDDVADFKKCQFLWGVWSVGISVVLWGAFFLLILGPIIQATSSYPRPSSSRPSFGSGQSFGSNSDSSSSSSSGAP